MLETALLFTVIASWAPVFGYHDVGITTATIAGIFYAIWAVGGILALVFHKPIERYTLAHHHQAA